MLVKTGRKRLNLTEEKAKNDLPRVPPPPSTFQRFFEKSTYVIDPDVIDFSSNFHKHPFDRQAAKKGRQDGRRKTCIICTTVQRVTTELRYEYITRCYLIDECRITELFSGNIVNFVKHVRSTSPDIMLVDEKLYAIKAWKKAS
ncbi:hypothetical protein TNCV_3956101 [Trichonephila clavipes]|nr:hypothetical protein TNCV_3956101 [Trichonephila clavipes]